MFSRWALLLLVCAPLHALAWGAVGHQIVATIAQIHLHPLVRAHLCTILPSWTIYPAPPRTHPTPFPPSPTECHLAPIAAWADRVRYVYPWSKTLHYVNPAGDHPPQKCTFGEHGWQDGSGGHGGTVGRDEGKTGYNVLGAMLNYTARLRDEVGPERDLALRFLTHYVGDMHQILHLTGSDRGGNGVPVRFSGRRTNLHSVFDSLLISRRLRTLANYTAPLPSRRLESALRGSIYDSYVRWIVWEGLGMGKGRNRKNAKDTVDDQSWAWWGNWTEWSACPASSAHSHIDPEPLFDVTTSEQLVLSPIAAQEKSQDDVDDVDDEPVDLPVCPFSWAKPLHPYVCSYAYNFTGLEYSDRYGDLGELVNEEEEEEHACGHGYGHGHDEEDAQNIDLATLLATPPDDLARRPRPHPGRAPPSSSSLSSPLRPLPELDSPSYVGRLDDSKLLERLLATAGVRLAAVLNSVLLDEAREAERERVSRKGQRNEG